MAGAGHGAGSGAGTGAVAAGLLCNAALLRTARILLDTPAIPKYTFAPLTAGR